MKKIIELKEIEKEYGKNDNKVNALRGIDFLVNEGEIIAIIGPSGSGKSTLLNILGFLDKATKGKYYFKGELVENLNDKELSKLRNKNIGFVVQNFALIEDYTVFQNVKVPLDYTKLSKREKKKRIEDVLKKLNIENKKEKYPNELSGGQNQRVAIARALVNNPEIILADEPTGALDRRTGKEVMDILKTLNKEGKTIIIITHDKFIADMCDRIIEIEDGKIKN